MPNFEKFEELAQRWLGAFDSNMDRLEAGEFRFSSLESEQATATSYERLAKAGRVLLCFCEKGDGTVRKLYPSQYEKIALGVEMMEMYAKAYGSLAAAS
jgi:hypothetical protein